MYVMKHIRLPRHARCDGDKNDCSGDAVGETLREEEVAANVGRESVPVNDVVQGIRSAFSLRATAPTTRSGVDEVHQSEAQTRNASTNKRVEFGTRLP